MLQAYRETLELIAQSPTNARFYWTDRDGDRRQRMSLTDLARAVLRGDVEPGSIVAERRQI